MAIQDRVEKKQKENAPKKSFGEMVMIPISDKIKAFFKTPEEHKEYLRTLAMVIDENYKFASIPAELIQKQVIKCASFGMVPNLYDFCFIVPMEAKGKYNASCKFEWGYMGLIEMAMRTGLFKDIRALTVHKGDSIEMELASGKVVHNPNLFDRGEIICAYAIAFFKNGVNRIEVMPMADFKKIKALSQNQALVSKWESEFYKKSVLKRLCKTLPFSKEDRRKLNDEDIWDDESLPPSDETETKTIDKVELTTDSIVKEPVDEMEKIQEKPKPMKQQIAERIQAAKDKEAEYKSEADELSKDAAPVEKSHKATQKKEEPKKEEPKQEEKEDDLPPDLFMDTGEY